MPIMISDVSLEVGVEAMNIEHHEILDAMNRVYDAKIQGIDGEAMNDLVARLGALCLRHFENEERFMAQIGYPERDAHEMLHARLRIQFQDHADAIRQAGGVPTDEFFYFLKFWLVSHIQGDDARYGAYANTAVAA